MINILALLHKIIFSLIRIQLLRLSAFFKRYIFSNMVRSIININPLIFSFILIYFITILRVNNIFKFLILIIRSVNIYFPLQLLFVLLLLIELLLLLYRHWIAWYIWTIRSSDLAISCGNYIGLVHLLEVFLHLELVLVLVLRVQSKNCVC